MQDAYAVEKNNVGTWALIGYTAPGKANDDGSSSTTNFTYSGATVSESGVTTQVTGAWTANNIPTLNECIPKSGGNWIVSTNAIGSAGQDSYQATTTCTELTPTFSKIGQ